MVEPTHANIIVAQVDTSRRDNSDNARLGVRATDNQWYSCFDQKLWPRLELGASLDIVWRPGGKEGTLRTITGILGTAASRVAPSANGAAPPSDRERNIVRESALRAACDLYGHSETLVESDTTVDWILHVADRFAAWVSQTEEEAPF